jgi:hypothetical protein
VRREEARRAGPRRPALRRHHLRRRPQPRGRSPSRRGWSPPRPAAGGGTVRRGELAGPASWSVGDAATSCDDGPLLRIVLLMRVYVTHVLQHASFCKNMFEERGDRTCYVLGFISFFFVGVWACYIRFTFLSTIQYMEALKYTHSILGEFSYNQLCYTSSLIHASYT